MNQWICQKTGLSIIEGSVSMYRVSSNRPDRGPLAPRPLDYKPFDDRKGWSRFDVGPASAAAGPGLTIYGATRRDTAFVEVLAWKSAPSATYSKLVEEAMFTGSSIDELLGDLHGLGIPVGGGHPRLAIGAGNLHVGDRGVPMGGPHQPAQYLSPPRLDRVLV